MTVGAAGRPWRLWVGLAGTVAVVVAVGLFGALRLPGGTTLAGSEVAAADEAPAAIEAAQEALDGLELRFTTEVGTTAAFTGEELGLTVDEDASRAPIARGLASLGAWAERITDGPVAVGFTTEPVAPDALGAVARSVSRDPEDADVEVRAAGVEVIDGVDGITADTGQVDAALDRALDQIATTPPGEWQDSLEVPVDGDVTAPTVTQADIDAVTADIERLERAEVTLTAETPVPPTEESGGTAVMDERTDTQITLSARELRALAAVEVAADAPAGERLELVADTASPPPRVVALLDQAEVPADLEAMVVDRSETPEPGDDLTDVDSISGEIVVENTEPGFRPDRQATLEAIIDTGLSGGGGVDVVGSEDVDVDPADLGIVEPVSTFTTFYTAGQSRVQNIQRIAEIVDGTIVRPGESYEVNHAVGRRTIENGFTTGGAILDGELVSDIGGGVSQFATTFFNAAWFAGVELVDWKPHSFYFSRYPAGREATINYPNVDLEFRNDTPHAILIDTDTDDTSVTVTFWSTPYWDVQTISGPCACGGSFSITVDRIRTAPGGEPIEESYTTTYTVPDPSR